jgi:hypothetical protein
MTISTPTTLSGLRQVMRSTEQTPGMSVLEHGLQVARYFEDLRKHVLTGTPLKYEWKLPEWVYDTALWEALITLQTVRRYQIYHDAGKPFCREVDELGRAHFPDHARVTGALWESMTAEHTVANLMAMDMDVHLLKGEGVPSFAARPEAATLLLTGLAEVHANASMFGGIDSTSFKIKHKHLKRRGNAIVRELSKLSTIGEAA